MKAAIEEKRASTDRQTDTPPSGLWAHASRRSEQIATRPATQGSQRLRRAARRRSLGGADGNQILTSAAAIVLIVLLVAEGITIVHMRGLLTAHMFIGLVLIGPVLLKLGSTGYRMVSYYAGSRAYRVKGPPLLPLRVMAPMLVTSTIAVLASGVLLLAAGRKTSTLLTIHKLAFIVFGVLMAVHFLAYFPRAMGSLRTDWSAARRRVVPGASTRATLVAAAVGGGAALAVALLPTVHAYSGR